MTSVFVGGSRKVSRLNRSVQGRIDNICTNGMTVLVGDANGVDKAVQRYLAERGYRNVFVYCSEGLCRNNVGGWDIRPVGTTARPKTRAFYGAKDMAMARDASYGLMVWDGRSVGTANNVKALLQSGKSVVVYLTPTATFRTLHTMEDLEHLLQQEHVC